MKVISILTSFALWVMLLSSVQTQAQTYIFGPKLGPSIGLQQWNGRQGDALVAWHAAAFIESFDEDSPSSLYAQLGYHVKGSAERNLQVDIIQGSTFRTTQTYQFRNLSLLLGAKRILDMNSKYKPFYTIGVRAEYTLSTNLDRYVGSPFQLYFPSNFFVNKLNYGVSAGGGFQYEINELIGGAVELTISPDVSKQYQQFPIPNVIDPRNVGSTRTLPEQNVRNLTLEISVSLRLLRKVEYY